MLQQPPTRKPITTATASQTTTAPTAVQFGKITKSTNGDRIVLYGPGGIGKTTLSCSLPGPVAFFDLEESLGKLLPSLEEDVIANNIVPVQGITTWQGIRDALHGTGWENIKSIVIDTGTKLQEMALEYMYKNIKNDKGVFVTRLEDFGYKAGYRHLFDTFSLLLADLDQHARAGRNVVLICHECAAKVPNPQGQDWIRFEPRLEQDDKFCQLRYRVKEWADHVLAMVYDVNVEKGKASGSGTRTIYTSELPFCMAKSRTAQGEFPVVKGENFWSNIIK